MRFAGHGLGGWVAIGRPGRGGRLVALCWPRRVGGGRASEAGFRYWDSRPFSCRSSCASARLLSFDRLAFPLLQNIARGGGDPAVR